MRNTYVLFLMSFGLAAQTVPGQTGGAPPSFEVASIKPSAPLNAAMLASGQMHLGVKTDGARVDIGLLPLSSLISVAYGLKPDEFSGPDWMGAQRWDILAKMPDNASAGQVPEMLQALLAERFKLKTHRESREHAVYALVVGKDGSKLKESPPDPETPAGGAKSGEAEGIAFGIGNGQMRMSRDAQGEGMVISAGQNGQVRMSRTAEGARMEASKMTLAQLAGMLSGYVDHPVVDMTGLPGSYRMVLDISLGDMANMMRRAGVAAPELAAGGDAGGSPANAASDPSSSSIFNSVRRLGLKLELRKEPITVLVIDHLERTPTEN